VAIKTSSLYQEIKEIIARGGNGTIGRWEAIFLVNGEEIKADQVTQFRVNANYAEFFAPQISLSFMLSGALYRNKLYRNRRDLRVRMTFTNVMEVGESDGNTRPIETYEYRAVLANEDDQVLQASSIAETNPANADLGSFQEYHVDLLNDVVFQLRTKLIGGVYVKQTTASVMRTLLTNLTQGVKVSADIACLGVDLIKPDNTEVRDHVIIEHGVRLVDLPKYLQRKVGGIYNTGLGAFYHKRHWYVFPLYDVTRFKNSKRTLTIANIPSREFPHQERTYKIDGGHVYIIATGDTKHVDRSERDQLNQGSGTRYVRSKTVFEGFAEVKGNKAFIDRSKNGNEYLADKSPTNLHYTPVSGHRVTDNHCEELTALAKRRGSVVQTVWENGYIGCLHPGMPVRLLYMHGETIRQIDGCLLSAESVSIAAGTMARSVKHQTTVVLSVFVMRTEVDN
jgi:hypothetical protein